MLKLLIVITLMAKMYCKEKLLFKNVSITIPDCTKILVVDEKNSTIVVGLGYSKSNNNNELETYGISQL